MTRKTNAMDSDSMALSFSGLSIFHGDTGTSYRSLLSDHVVDIQRMTRFLVIHTNAVHGLGGEGVAAQVVTITDVGRYFQKFVRNFGDFIA